MRRSPVSYSRDPTISPEVFVRRAPSDSTMLLSKSISPMFEQISPSCSPTSSLELARQRTPGDNDSDSEEFSRELGEEKSPPQLSCFYHLSPNCPSQSEVGSSQMASTPAVRPATVRSSRGKLNRFPWWFRVVSGVAFAAIVILPAILYNIPRNEESTMSECVEMEESHQHESQSTMEYSTPPKENEEERWQRVQEVCHRNDRENTEFYAKLAAMEQKLSDQLEWSATAMREYQHTVMEKIDRLDSEMKEYSMRLRHLEEDAQGGRAERKEGGYHVGPSETSIIVNVADRQRGARILSLPPTYNEASSSILRFLFTHDTRGYLLLDRAFILPYEAYCFESATGEMMLQLSEKARLDSLSYVHAYWRRGEKPPANAPKQLLLQGCSSSSSSQCVDLAECEFSGDDAEDVLVDPALQLVRSQRCATSNETRSLSFEFVRFIARSNHGSSHTCLSVIRVLGVPEQSGEAA